MNGKVINRTVPIISLMLKEKKAMKGEMDKRTIYGNAEFTEKIKEGYKVEDVIKPRGRPKK